MTPGLHATLLSLASVALLVVAAMIYARSPSHLPSRIYSAYGLAVAWYLFCMSRIAGVDDPAQAEIWARLLLVGIGMTPGLAVHVNSAVAGLEEQRRGRIRFFYWLSFAVVLLCVVNPYLLNEPYLYSWGYMPAFTLWGLVPVLAVLAAVVDTAIAYQGVLRNTRTRRLARGRLQPFHAGNVIASLALVDCLPMFGVPVYPFGWAVLVGMLVATIVATLRYGLIDVTPEYALPRIFHTMPDGVIVTDSTGCVRLANQAVAGMLSRTIDQLQGRLLEDIESPVLTSLVEADFAPGPVDIVIEREGQPVNLQASASKLFDAADEAVGQLYMLRDVTRQRDAEARHEELQGWIRSGQRFETLGVMAGGIAHDFNNLLTTIIGNTELARGARSGDITSELDAIETAANWGTDLTSQMLAYAGQQMTVDGPLEVNQLCTDIDELLRSSIPQNVKLEVVAGESLPTVRIDSTQMTQIILNLVTNAAEALEGEAGHVRLRTYTSVLEVDSDDETSGSSLSHAMIEVSDDGCGMDEATRERVFDPFYSTKFTGRGLGLATVLSIVESHNGRVRVDSQPGEGTTFTVAFPAAERIEAHAIAAEIRTPEGALALLVDDDESVRSVTARMLEKIGFEVLEAEDGETALALFAEHRSRIVVVVLDLVMPGIGGIEVHRRLRLQHEDVPVLLISGFHDVGMVDSALDANTQFLRKPFRLAQLTEALQTELSTMTARESA